MPTTEQLRIRDRLAFIKARVDIIKMYQRVINSDIDYLEREITNLNDSLLVIAVTQDVDFEIATARIAKLEAQVNSQLNG